MKCKQTDDLLFSYCDRREIPPHRLHELEAHLEECPECRHKADFTLKEREALAYDGDIPEISANLASRILTAVSQGVNPPALSWSLRMRSRLGNRGWWALGMAAAIVLSWLMLPGILEDLDKPANPTKIAVSGKKELTLPSGKENAAQQESAADQTSTETPKSTAVRGAAPASQNYQQQFGASVALGYKDIEPARVSIGRGESAAPIAPTAGSLDTAGQAIIFQPSYLPPNFHFTRRENDLNDALSLYYENPQGGFICLKTLPGLDQETEVMKSRVMEDRGEGDVSPTTESLSKTQENLDDSTVISWTVQHENTAYRLELTGSLPREELFRVAASVK